MHRFGNFLHMRLQRKMPGVQQPTVGLGLSRRYASAPAGTKNTSFVPQIASDRLDRLVPFTLPVGIFDSFFMSSRICGKRIFPTATSNKSCSEASFRMNGTSLATGKLPLARLWQMSNTCSGSSSVPPLSRFASHALSSWLL
jgi:hypothetical protein